MPTAVESWKEVLRDRGGKGAEPNDGEPGKTGETEGVGAARVPGDAEAVAQLNGVAEEHVGVIDGEIRASAEAEAKREEDGNGAGCKGECAGAEREA